MGGSFDRTGEQQPGGIRRKLQSTVFWEPAADNVICVISGR